MVFMVAQAHMKPPRPTGIPVRSGSLISLVRVALRFPESLLDEDGSADQAADAFRLACATRRSTPGSVAPSARLRPPLHSRVSRARPKDSRDGQATFHAVSRRKPQYRDFRVKLMSDKRRQTSDIGSRKTTCARHRVVSQEVVSFCDNTSGMNVAQPIDRGILRSVRAKSRASVFSPRHFADFGNADAVRKALSRLAKAGKIRRIRRGLYDLPQAHPIIGQTAPDIMATVRALMEGSHAQWQFTGAYAANALGLSDQVPAKVIILTDGVPRKVSLGKLVLMFRRAAPRNLLGAGTRAGLVIQALRYLRGSTDMPKHVARLRKDLDAGTKKDLASIIPKIVTWMRPIVQQITVP